MLPGEQVVFTAELRRRLPGDCGIAVTAVHPGEVMTDVVRSLPALMQGAYRFFMRPFCLSPAEGRHPSHISDEVCRISPSACACLANSHQCAVVGVLACLRPLL